MKIRPVISNPDLVIIDYTYKISLSTGEITGLNNEKLYDIPEYIFKFRDEALAGE